MPRLPVSRARGHGGGLEDWSIGVARKVCESLSQGLRAATKLRLNGPRPGEFTCCHVFVRTWSIGVTRKVCERLAQGLRVSPNFEVEWP